MQSISARLTLALLFVVCTVATAQAITLNNGDILVIHNNSNPITAAVVRIDPATGDADVVSGDFPGTASVGTGPEFAQLRGIALESTGDILVTNSFDQLIRVDPATGDRTIVSGCADSTCSSLIGGGLDSFLAP